MAPNYIVHFEYQLLELDRQDIRLLRVHQARNYQDLICCTLKNEPLDQTGDYYALSYTWGEGPCTQTVLINGRHFQVRQGLFAFLQWASQHDTEKWLWIDAVCIDQSSIEERNRQVKKMAEIYERATAVYVWLWPASHELGVLFETLVTLGPNQYPDLSMIELRELYDGLLQLPYWGRVWVIQEFFLARDIVIILCGQTVSLSAFLKCVDILEKLTLDCSEATASNFFLFSHIERRESKPQILAINKPTTNTFKHCLTLQNSLSFARCTDIRDQVYARLSIVEHGNDFRVDYSEYQPVELARRAFIHFNRPYDPPKDLTDETDFDKPFGSYLHPFKKSYILFEALCKALKLSANGFIDKFTLWNSVSTHMSEVRQHGWHLGEWPILMCALHFLPFVAKELRSRTCSNASFWVSFIGGVGSIQQDRSQHPSESLIPWDRYLKLPEVEFEAIADNTQVIRARWNPLAHSQTIPDSESVLSIAKKGSMPATSRIFKVTPYTMLVRGHDRRVLPSNICYEVEGDSDSSLQALCDAEIKACFQADVYMYLKIPLFDNAIELHLIVPLAYEGPEPETRSLMWLTIDGETIDTCSGLSYIRHNSMPPNTMLGTNDQPFFFCLPSEILEYYVATLKVDPDHQPRTERSSASLRVEFEEWYDGRKPALSVICFRPNAI